MQSFRFCIQIHADRDASKNLSGWLEHFHPVMENGVQSGVDPNPLRKCVHQSKQKEVYTAAQQITVYVGATSWGCIGALIFQCTIRWVTFFHVKWKANKVIMLLLLFEGYGPVVWWFSESGKLGRLIVKSKFSISWLEYSSQQKRIWKLLNYKINCFYS